MGAGVGGLAAAARLAARGHTVNVFEASGEVGGKLGVIERRTDAGVFRFDTGPTVLTMPEVFAELFAATGDSIDKVLTLRELDPMIRYRFGDGTILTTTRDLVSQAARFEQVLGAGAGCGLDVADPSGRADVGCRRRARPRPAIEHPAPRRMG